MKRSQRDVRDAPEGVLRRFFRREPKQGRSRALVDAVVQAADDLLRRGEPIDEVTVERVTERAGIGMGSFYEYFSSKDSLVGILIAKVTHHNFEDLSRKLDALDHDSLEGVTRAFAHVIIDTYLAHPNRTRIIVEGIGRLGLGRLVHEEKDRFAAVLAARAAPFLPGHPIEAVTATMRLVADAIMGALVFTAMRGDPIDAEELAEALSSLAMGQIQRRHPTASH